MNRGSKCPSTDPTISAKLQVTVTFKIKIEIYVTSSTHKPPPYVTT